MTTTVSLDRSNELELARVAVLQALFRVQIPVNAQVVLERFQDINEPIGADVTAQFLDPRRFVLWAVKEGLVPEEFRKDCLRYARAA